MPLARFEPNELNSNAVREGVTLKLLQTCMEI